MAHQGERTERTEPTQDEQRVSSQKWASYVIELDGVILARTWLRKKNLTTLQVKTLNQNDETIKRLEQVKRKEFEWNFFSIQIGQVCVGDKETEITLKKVKT